MKNSVMRVMIEEFIQTKTAFTSVDLANKVKEKVGWIRNREVANMLRSDKDFDEALDDGDFTRELIQVTLHSGKVVDATLYLPLFTDANTAYPDGKRNARCLTKGTAILGVPDSTSAQVNLPPSYSAPVMIPFPPLPVFSATITANMVAPDIQNVIKDYQLRGIRAFTYMDIIQALPRTISAHRCGRKAVSDWLRRNCRIMTHAANPAKDRNVYCV